MPARIGCVVEGHGEVKAVPIVVRRLARDLGFRDVEVPHPLRKPRAQLLRPDELENAVDLMARRVRPGGGILVLLDADDDCPKELAPRLGERVRRRCADVPTAVVLAKREYEAWLIAGIEPLAARKHASRGARAAADPEGVRGAKEFLRKALGKYSPGVDQARLTSLFKMQAARERSPSFDKFWREMQRLLAAVGSRGG